MGGSCVPYTDTPGPPLARRGPRGLGEHRGALGSTDIPRTTLSSQVPLLACWATFPCSQRIPHNLSVGSPAPSSLAPPAPCTPRLTLSGSCFLLVSGDPTLISLLPPRSLSYSFAPPSRDFSLEIWKVQLPHHRKKEREVAQSCLTLCDPMNCSLPGPSVHGILQARVLEWGAISSPGDLPDPGIELRSPALQADALPSEPPGKPHKHSTYVSRETGQMDF